MIYNQPIHFPYYDSLPISTNSTLITRAIHNFGLSLQTPDGMNLVVTLASASVALQGLIDVELPSGKVCPVALNLICIAGSGERKSSLEEQAFKGMRKFMKEEVERLKRENIKYEILIGDFKTKEKSLNKKLKQSSGGERDYCIEELITHQQCKPQKPKPRLMNFEDVTPQAMQHEMQGYGANAVLSSSEGGKVLNSPLVQSTSFLNDLWSGQSTTITRKSVESAVIEEPRLTVCIMTQPSTVDTFIKRAKDDIRDNGFWSRFLIVNPPSNCGTRYSNGFSPSKEDIDKFNERTYQLLSLLPLNPEEHEKTTIKLSYESKNILNHIYNDIESHMQVGGRFENAKDHASKLVENIARVAAILHSFESFSKGEDIEISTTTLYDAINIVAYFSCDFMKIFCSPPKYVMNSDKLMYWFNQCLVKGFRYVRHNHILQYGPKELRKKKDLNEALEYLSLNPTFSIITYKKIKVIDLYPNNPFDYHKVEFDLSLNITVTSSMRR